MKNFRRLFFAVALTALFTVPALGGDTQGPSAPSSGETQGPAAMAPGETQGPAATVAGTGITQTLDSMEPGETNSPPFYAILWAIGTVF